MSKNFNCKQQKLRRLTGEEYIGPLNQFVNFVSLDVSMCEENKVLHAAAKIILQ